jgi:hypothetical protein
MKSHWHWLGWSGIATAIFGLGYFTALLTNRGADLRPVSVNEPRVAPTQKTSGPAAQTIVPLANTSGNMSPDVFDALRRKAKGDYIRDSNIPSRRQQREDHVRRSADHNIKQREGEYTDLFAALGLDNETIAQLRNHLQQMYEAKMDASRALGEVLQVREDYDKRIKTLLGDKDDAYRAMEGAYESRLEFESFSKFASRQGHAVPATEQRPLEDLIKRFEAYSGGVDGNWGGPYKAVVLPVGGEDLKPFLLSRMERLQSHAESLLAEARGAGLTEGTLRQLEAYYRSEFENQQMQLARVENPDLNRILMLKRQLDAMKARPNPNQPIIERMEGELRRLHDASGTK